MSTKHKDGINVYTNWVVCESQLEEISVETGSRAGNALQEASKYRTVPLGPSTVCGTQGSYRGKNELKVLSGIIANCMGKWYIIRWWHQTRGLGPQEDKREHSERVSEWVWFPWARGHQEASGEGVPIGFPRSSAQSSFFCLLKMGKETLGICLSQSALLLKDHFCQPWALLVSSQEQPLRWTTQLTHFWRHSNVWTLF